MDRFSYEKLRQARPELYLPAWQRLRRTDRHRAKRLTSEQIIARRVAKLLARALGTVDRLQPTSLPDIYLDKRYFGRTKIVPHERLKLADPK